MHTVCQANNLLRSQRIVRNDTRKQYRTQLDETLKCSLAHFDLSLLVLKLLRSQHICGGSYWTGKAQAPSISTEIERWSNSKLTIRRVFLAWRSTIPRTPFSGPLISSTVLPMPM